MKINHTIVSVLALALLAVGALLPPAAGHAQDMDKVKKGMALLQADAAKLGPPKLGGTATIFAKSGEEYVRVATNVKKADGSRAVGTILDPKGKVIQVINKNEAYFGAANILGKDYVTGYAPIHDAAGKIIGIYYVG